MPIYEYAPGTLGCSDCAPSFEVMQKIADPELTHCETCKQPIRRVISASAVIVRPFTGNGELWMVRTDNDLGPGVPDGSNFDKVTRAWRIDANNQYVVPYSWLGGQVAPGAPLSVYGQLAFKFGVRVVVAGVVAGERDMGQEHVEFLALADRTGPRAPSSDQPAGWPGVGQ